MGLLFFFVIFRFFPMSVAISIQTSSTNYKQTRHEKTDYRMMKAFDKCPTLVGHYTLSIPFHAHPPIPICSRRFPVLLVSFLSSFFFHAPLPLFFLSLFFIPFSFLSSATPPLSNACSQANKHQRDLHKILGWGEMENKQSYQNDNNTTTTTGSKEEEGLRRPLGIGGGGISSSDRLRRDEWSEGAVSSLLDSYEAKWVLRNRTKLKGQDWEDVARQVSARGNGTRSPKTMTQCKNKIESMKKRYRSESASSDPSSWPLFNRLHLLLRCRVPPPQLPSSPPPPQPLLLLDQPPPPPSALPPLPLPPPPPPPRPVDDGNRQESPGINGVVAVAEVGGNGS